MIVELGRMLKPLQRPLEERMADWDRYMLQTYDLGRDEYDKLVVAQCGRCAICGSAGRELFIDHDHHTKRVRGLLCLHCNTGLGKLGDSIESIIAALSYLLEAELGVETTSN